VVEALPGTEEDVIKRLESNIRSLEGVSSYLDRGGIPALVDAVFDGFEREVVEVRDLEYGCRCDRQEVLRQLLPLAQRDLDALVGSNGLCEACCAYCGASYVFSTEELTSTH
jgi:molecular chaperone Hsp33